MSAIVTRYFVQPSGYEFRLRVMRLSANSYEIERQAKGSDEWSFASTVAVLSANRIHSSGLTSAESQVVWDTLVSIGTLSNLGY